MIPPCFYHDPALCEAVSRAVGLSMATRQGHAVLFTPRENFAVIPVADPEGVSKGIALWLFHGYTCMYYVDGVCKETGTFLPNAFQVKWIPR